MSKVSIIMPAFNSATYLEETINSVLAQTHKDWELLIADNNSTDTTAELIHSFTRKDSRIKYIEASEQKGAGFARNQAIKAASGRFIAFLDSDDLWLPTKLEEQVEFMLENDLYLSYTHYKTFGKKTQEIKKASKTDYVGLLKHNVIGCLTAMYDVERLGKKYYMPHIRNGQDWCLWCFILRDSKSTAMCIEKPLALYRVSNTSLSSNKIRCTYYHYKGFRDVLGLNIVQSLYYLAFYVVIHGTALIKSKLF